MKSTPRLLSVLVICTEPTNTFALYHCHNSWSWGQLRRYWQKGIPSRYSLKHFFIDTKVMLDFADDNHTKGILFFHFIIRDTNDVFNYFDARPVRPVGNVGWLLISWGKGLGPYSANVGSRDPGDERWTGWVVTALRQASNYKVCHDDTTTA
jgi:hypothetical protein